MFPSVNEATSYSPQILQELNFSNNDWMMVDITCSWFHGLVDIFPQVDRRCLCLPLCLKEGKSIAYFHLVMKTEYTVSFSRNTLNVSLLFSNCCSITFGKHKKTGSDWKTVLGNKFKSVNNQSTNDLRTNKLITRLQHIFYEHIWKAKLYNYFVR